MWIEHKGELINLANYSEVRTTEKDVQLAEFGRGVKILRCEDSGEVAELFQIIRIKCLGITMHPYDYRDEEIEQCQ